jgi:hypothetical protein
MKAKTFKPTASATVYPSICAMRAFMNVVTPCVS